MENIFIQLAIVLSLASLFGFVIRRLNLPLLVAYLLVGICLSTFAIFNLKTSPVLVLPDIGIAFVLFLIGMELDLREMKALGKPIIISGLIQITISAIAGYLISTFFGFKGLEAFYIGVGLSFSSTVVVVKMLLERKDLTSLYGKLSLGVLLLEDIMAISVLMFLSFSGSFTSFSLQNSLPVLTLLAKLVILSVTAFIFARYILELIFKSIAKSSELLFLIALTWCFVFTSLAIYLGFSVVIGAFLAGIALAASPFHYHISGKIKPLRDFFIILFFVFLGTQVNLATGLSNIGLILIFTLYAIIAKPLIYLLMFGSFGFRKHTIFQAAVNLSQVSEFGLIILLVGVKLGVVDQRALSIMALTSALSITFSSILISRSKNIYPLLKPLLNFFEVKNKYHQLEHRADHDLSDHVVLIGGHRVGGPIVDFLAEAKIPFIVLDFNPKIVEKLLKHKIPVIYGDLGDQEVLENLKLETAKLIISTVPSLEDNKILLNLIKRNKIQAKIVVRAEEDGDGHLLKKHGADFVIYPEDLSADYLVEQLKSHWPRIQFNSIEGV